MRYRCAKQLIDSKRAGKGKSPYPAQSSYMGVLSDDFADVDFREELCYHSLPKKQLEEGEMRRFQKNTKNSGKFCR